MSTYCCNGLKSLADNRNKNGFSLEVYSEGGEPSFWIIMRSIAEEHIESIVINTNASTEAVFWTRVHISFCPWCGKKLEKFYKKNWKILFSPIENFSTPVCIDNLT